MPAVQSNDVMRYIRRIVGGPSPATTTDQQLLERYVTTRDEGSFQAIVDRHGPMVLGVCRRILAKSHDAEDAFQATFLILVRKAKSIAHSELLGNWLYGVAYRVALEARGRAMRWRSEASELPDIAATHTDSESERRELRALLDDELNRLPQKYRGPIVLCYLEGMSNEEASRQLGCPKGTVFSRLARAKEMLRSRLARRMTLASGVLGMEAFVQTQSHTAVSSQLLFSIIKAASAFQGEKIGVLDVVPAKVLSLAQGVMKNMFLNRLKAAALCSMSILSVIAATALWTSGAMSGEAMKESFGDPVASDVSNEPLAGESLIPDPTEMQAPILKYGDDQPDGKKSLGGSGELIEFTLPKPGLKVSGLRVHGSRYGTPQAPNESFLIFFLNGDRSEIVHTEMAAYSLFERGAEQWVEIKFRRAIEVPEKFWVNLDFRPGRTKGVFVSYDTSSGGKYSKVGLPGLEATQPDFAGDWMVEVQLAK